MALLDSTSLIPRLRAATWHLLISATVAGLAAALVFGLWYPGLYRLLAGGRGLFMLVVSVDVVLGPLLTLVIFDVAKGWPHLRRDLVVIGALQLAGLAYGLHTVYVVRPVALVYESNRFRVVAAADVYAEELPKALPAYRSLPLTGPWALAVRPAEAGAERSEAIMMALKGVDTGQRPPFWLPYAEVQARARAEARPLSVLLERHPERREELLRALAGAELAVADAKFLPVIARGDWVAVLDVGGKVATFLAADGFF